MCTGCTASDGLAIIFFSSAAFGKYFARNPLVVLNDVMDRMVRVEVHAIQFNTV